jgi:hypothetical protein
MSALLFLHDLDDRFGLFPEALQDCDLDMSPHIVVAPECGHTPLTTVDVNADRGVLSVVCATCGAQVGVAVGDHSENPTPCGHGGRRLVLYSEGRLVVMCGVCATPLAVWHVAPCVQEAPL